jgi:hypothetical protein
MASGSGTALHSSQPVSKAAGSRRGVDATRLGGGTCRAALSKRLLHLMRSRSRAPTPGARSSSSAACRHRAGAMA